MSAQLRKAVDRVRAALERDGLLLAHDAELPSATAMIAGHPIRGGWWSHPLGKLIYQALEALEADVAWPKLVRRKVTLVHRRLWPPLFIAGTCRARWQTKGLPPDARWLLDLIDKKESIRSDTLEVPTKVARKVGAIVTDLEQRLLVTTRSEHTEGGHHARYVETWTVWRRRARLSIAQLPSIADALEHLTAPVRKLTARKSLKGWLPWMT